MSDRAELTRLGEAPDADDVTERHVVLRALVRARALLVLVPLVVGLLVAASIGASKLWADLPERTGPPPDVTCWNGEEAPAADCPEPSGLDGLRWVFPSFRPYAVGCRRVDRPQRAVVRPLELTCAQQFDDRPVTIVYSVRTSVEQSLAYFRRTYGVRPTGDAGGERLVFRATRPDDGRFRTTVVYARHPFAVTVEAPSREVRDEALEELVRFRPADDLRVRS